MLIGGLPAWRATVDQHACPAVSPSGPDVGGSVLMGSPTVLINNQMACRVGDIVVEKPGAALGPVNPITAGCATVLVGVAGGGKVAAAAEYAPGIVIQGGEAFRTKTIENLDELFKTPTGKDLVEKIDLANKRTGYVMLVREAANAEDANHISYGEDTYSIDPQTGAQVPGQGAAFSVVEYRADQCIDFEFMREDTTTETVPTPPEKVLGHEMTHAVHAAQGIKGKRRAGEMYNVEEEDSTVVTENSLRDQQKLPRRPRYLVDGFSTRECP